jgi:methionine-rich copper-binding protein CopC
MRSHTFSVAFLSALVLAPMTGWTHAYLVKSSPARRALLTRSPARVELWFNERVEGRFSHLSVWDAEGMQVDTRDMQLGPEDPKKLSVGVPRLGPGVYTVKFRVLSVDGHIAESQFPFTLRGSP